MTWQRAPVAAALADLLSASLGGVKVFASPPSTLNPPSVVIGRETNVNLATAALGVDEATLPVAVVGPMDGDDVVDYLRDLVRKTVDANPTLGGVVPSCVVTAYRNSRNVTVAGVEILAADVILTVWSANGRPAPPPPPPPPAPVITALSPSPLVAGTDLTVTGTDMAGVIQVLIGPWANGVVEGSATQVRTHTSPALAPGPYQVSVTDAAWTQSNELPLTVIAP